MKITFAPPTDNLTHRYCVECNADAVSLIKVDGLVKWQCSACGKVSDRYLHIGNTPEDGKWWLDDSQEIWHESAGVFVRSPEGKYLFFERIAYPLGYTIPAGHVDNGEEGGQAAVRELGEEVGVQSKQLTHIVSTDIVGDKCVGGADSHKWHVYREDLDQALDVTVLEEEEGKQPVWLTLDEAKQKPLPFAIKYLLDNYADRIEP
jgi:8-oxo-dGTP pyrophosphatase MutT (NUDIX family)